MAARQTAPVIGALCSRSAHSTQSLDPPRRQLWTFGLGYRYQSSFRHYVGTVEQKQREVLGNQIVNNYHLLDLSVSRMITPRWSVNASLPILVANRNQLYNPRGYQEVASIGDATVGGRAWLLRPPIESGGNIGVGLSLKMPTGKYKASTLSLDRDGNQIVATNDQSIQPGDGGTDFAVDIQAYKPTIFNSMLYFSGTYLFNPRDTNGVSTFRTRRGEEVMSVTDQYLFRGGISRGVPRFRGLVVSFGGRIEGVPVRDAIGGSNGFRRPGYAISLDPGFMYSYGSYLFSCNVPFAVERNRRTSVTDYMNRVHGDAAFADYALVLSVTRRF